MSQETNIMTDAAHISVGKLGEALAVRYLQERVYTILMRNFRKKWGEIDVIAKKDNILHFVEVKTVSRDSFYETFGVADNALFLRPEEHMDERKLKRLERAIYTYLYQYKLIETANWQCDLLAIELNQTKKEARCRFYENVSFAK